MRFLSAKQGVLAAGVALLIGGSTLSMAFAIQAPAGRTPALPDAIL